MTNLNDIYTICTNTWKMFKQLGDKKLNDTEWEQFYERSNVLIEHTKETLDRNKYLLFREMLMCISNYYERLERENGRIESK